MLRMSSALTNSVTTMVPAQEGGYRASSDGTGPPVVPGTRGSMLSLGNALRGALCAVLRGRAPASLPWRERVLEALKALGAEGAAEASLKYIQRQEYKEAKWVAVVMVVLVRCMDAREFHRGISSQLMLMSAGCCRSCCRCCLEGGVTGAFVCIGTTFQNRCLNAICMSSHLYCEARTVHQVSAKTGRGSRVISNSASLSAVPAVAITSMCVSQHCHSSNVQVCQLAGKFRLTSMY
jgi:hypothetical protein